MCSVDTPSLDTETTSEHEVPVLYLCRSCKAVRRVVYTHKVEVRQVDGRPRRKVSWWTDGQVLPGGAFVPAMQCACGKGMESRPVVGTLREEVRCDSKCWNATGGACECSCGGENHGAAHG